MKRRRLTANVPLALAVALVALAQPRAAQACAGCRNPSIPITRLTNVQMAPGEIRGSAILSATSINVVHEAGCADLANCHEVPAQPLYLHDQDIYPTELRAVFELGLSPSWGIEAQLPFRVLATRIRFATPAGAPYVPLDPDVHHRNETLAGIADPWLLGRYGTFLSGALVTLRAGLSLPIGRTEQDPFALGDIGIRHQHIQFGTGTFDPVAAFDMSKGFGKLQLSAYVQGQISVYQNRHGFRAPARAYAGVQLGTRLVGKLSGAIGPDVLYEGPERWGGAIRQDANLGRTEVLIGTAISHNFDTGLITLVVRVPVYRHIVQGSEVLGRLSSPVMASLIFSRSFYRARRPAPAHARRSGAARGGARRRARSR